MRMCPSYCFWHTLSGICAPRWKGCIGEGGILAAVMLCAEEVKTRNVKAMYA